MQAWSCSTVRGGKEEVSAEEDEDAETPEDLLPFLWEAHCTRGGKGKKGKTVLLELDRKTEETPIRHR